MYHVLPSSSLRRCAEWTLATSIPEDIVNICVLKDIRPLGVSGSGWRSLSWNKSFLEGCILMNDVSETGSELSKRRTDFPWGFRSARRSPPLLKWDEIQLYLFVLVISLPLSLGYLNEVGWKVDSVDIMKVVYFMMFIFSQDATRSFFRFNKAALSVIFSIMSLKKCYKCYSYMHIKVY